MLTDEETEEIIKLIKQGLKDYKIGKITGHSPNTIKLVRNNFENTKLKNKYDLDINKEYTSKILRNIKNYLENVLKTKNLKEQEKQELKELIEQFKELLKHEIDDRFENEKKITIEKRDEEWQDLITTSYIKKEEKDKLKQKIEELESTIIHLREEIKEKNDICSDKDDDISQIKAFHQTEIRKLNEKIEKLTNENENFQMELGSMDYYIDNKLDSEVRLKKKQNDHKEQELFDRELHIDKKQKELDEIFLEADERLKAATKLEQENAKQKGDIEKKQKDIENKYDTISKYADVLLKSK
jgi:hypothetical protein